MLLDGKGQKGKSSFTVARGMSGAFPEFVLAAHPAFFPLSCFIASALV